MTDIVRIFVGFDSREAIAYHTFCQSVLEKSSLPVSFVPLHREFLINLGWRHDGTTAFTLSRYLVPQLCDFKGWALFVDGDMICDKDIAGLWNERGDVTKAAYVVKHDYKTKHRRKMMGTPFECANEDYPRKNWSSVVLWNCEHPANSRLTALNVSEMLPSYLHQFLWLKDEEIGSLPEWWNYLVGEDPPASPSLYHYTLGVPGVKHYSDDTHSWKWHAALINALQCLGEVPSNVVERAERRVGDGVQIGSAA